MSMPAQNQANAVIIEHLCKVRVVRQEQHRVVLSRVTEGSAQILTSAWGSFQVSSALRLLRDSSARPNVPSRTVGRPMYQNTQYRLSW